MTLAAAPETLRIDWKQRRSGWLMQTLADRKQEIPPVGEFAKIEKFAAETNQKGPLPLWEGYKNAYKETSPGQAQRPMERRSTQTRTPSSVGRLYAWLVRQRLPLVVVEFGTGFGISGMYWLHGLEANARGHLYTFEPNDAWRALAVENLARVGSRFTSVAGTFEENVDRLPPSRGIDIALVDAIHTSEFVYPQVELVKARMKTGGIIVLDDIRFSENMGACWTDLSQRADVAASAEVSGRIGIMEIAAKPEI